jgi:uncharacterized protein (TIGR03435 family)
MTGTNVYPGGRVLLQNLSLKAMIEAAFGFSYWQISGGESWTNDTTFDVEGRAPEEDMGAPFNLGHTWFTLEDPRLRQMLQTLLNDRFQLKAHIEKKTGLIYYMEKSGKPLFLTPTKQPEKVMPAHQGFCGIGRAASTWVVDNCTTTQIASFASAYVLHHAVYDNTGLQDHFDFRYQIVQTDPSAVPDNDSSFLDALDAMGFKLRQTTGGFATFVIDHAEKPSPN